MNSALPINLTEREWIYRGRRVAILPTADPAVSFVRVDRLLLQQVVPTESITADGLKALLDDFLAQPDTEFRLGVTAAAEALADADTNLFVAICADAPGIRPMEALRAASAAGYLPEPNSRIAASFGCEPKAIQDHGPYYARAVSIVQDLAANCPEGIPADTADYARTKIGVNAGAFAYRPSARELSGTDMQNLDDACDQARNRLSNRAMQVINAQASASMSPQLSGCSPEEIRQIATYKRLSADADEQNGHLAAARMGRAFAAYLDHESLMAQRRLSQRLRDLGQPST